jgi:putative acetyltransferase
VTNDRGGDGGGGFTLRRYLPQDEDAVMELWQRAWQRVYPDIDFAARLSWWRERWRAETMPASAVVVAERGRALVGFVTVELSNGYVDQIVVAPEQWGTGVAAALLDEARHLSPARLSLTVNTDNARAIRFYRKHGFSIVGESRNPHSGRPVHEMVWMPSPAR